MRDISVLLFAVSTVLLAATWLVYPMWLRIRAAAFPSLLPVGRHARWPTVTIVVVVRNDAEALRQLLPNLLALAYPADLRRILVVSVCSTDFTDAVAHLFAHRGVELLKILKPGAGVENHVRRYMDSEIVVRVHPDARLRPSALAALVGPFADPSVGVAYARELSAEGGGDRRSDEPAYRRFERWLRELETRVFGTVSARGSLYAVRGPLYRAPVPGGLSPDFAEILMAREHGYRAVYEHAAVCSVVRERSLGIDYHNLMHAVKRDVVTLLAKRHLLDPRRYGAFAWILLGHKLGRWLTPWALLAGLMGLMLLAPSEPWARDVLALFLALALAAFASWLAPARTLLGRLAAVPGRLAAAAVAMAHACVSALRVTPESTFGLASRPSQRRVRVHV